MSKPTVIYGSLLPVQPSILLSAVLELHYANLLIRKHSATGNSFE